jgi:chromosome segregation ATPase
MDNNIDNLKKFIETIKTFGFWRRIFGWKTIRQQLVDASSDLQKLVTNYENLKEQNTHLNSANSEITTELKMASGNLIKKEEEVFRINSVIQENAGKLTQFAIDLSARDTTIQNHESRINLISTDNKVLIEKNTNLAIENKRMSSEAATNTESITNLSKRKNELDIELTGYKLKLGKLEEELQAVKQQNAQLLADEENRKEKYEKETSTLTSIREQIQNDRKKKWMKEPMQRLNVLRPSKKPGVNIRIMQRI